MWLQWVIDLVVPAEVDKAMGTYAEATSVINCVLGALNNLHVPEGNLDGGKSKDPNGSSLVSQDVNNLLSVGGEEGDCGGGRSSKKNGSSLVCEAVNNDASFGGKELEQINDRTSSEETLLGGGIYPPYYVSPSLRFLSACHRKIVVEIMILVMTLTKARQRIYLLRMMATKSARAKGRG